MSFRRVGLIAALAQLVLMTAYVVFEAIYGQGLWYGLVGFVGILVFPAVGLAILNRHPRHLVGLLFCVSQVGWAVNNLAGSYVRTGAFPFTWLAVWLYIWPGILSSAVLVVLLLVFPDGRFLSPRWRRVGQAVLVVAAVTGLAAAVAPGPVDPSIGIAAANPLGVSGIVGDIAGAVSNLGYPLFVPMFVLAAVALVRRYRRSGIVEREQLKWFASSVVLAALLSVGALVLLSVYPSADTAPVWAQLVNELAILSVSLVPIAAAIAILRYRLYDIDVLIRRTLIYAAVSAVLAAAYIGAIALSQAVLAPFTGGSGVAVAISTLAVVALFQPVRTRIRTAVDRRFYRSRFDAGRTLEAFSARLSEEVDLDALRAALLVVVGDTMQPTHASLWLREVRNDFRTPPA